VWYALEDDTNMAFWMLLGLSFENIPALVRGKGLFTSIWEIMA